MYAYATCSLLMLKLKNSLKDSEPEHYDTMPPSLRHRWARNPVLGLTAEKCCSFGLPASFRTWIWIGRLFFFFAVNEKNP
jgi:hypothetical protein